jgi:hypothetical protein
MPEALGLVQNPDEAIEFKEHKFWAAGNPFWRYTNSTGGAPANTFWQSTAQVGTDQGLSYVFFVMRGSLLNGATLNIRHSLTINLVINYGIYVYDGAYDRTSDVDFPPSLPLLLKGNGLIQTVNETAASFAVKTETYTLSFTNSLTWVTLFFRIADGGGGVNTAIATYYNMSIVRGSTTLFSTDFDGNVMCDLAEESMIWCSDNGWPDSNLNSSGYLDAGIVDIDPCIPTDFEIMNPSALAEDGTPWVFTESKFYWFNATYINFNLTGGDEASIRFSPDGSTNVTVTYAWLNDVNGLFSVSDSPDFITVPTVARNGTGAVYNSTSLELWVIFPIWFTDNAPDAQNVDVFYACTGLDYIDSGEDFHIYNQGGLVERDTTDNATFTSGGDWFEGCVFEDGVIQANQTWRKLQHYQTEYALRFYENSSGAWIPEDQFMQTFQHSGGGAEKYGGILDWILRWKIWGYDNSSSTWVRIFQVSMWMGDGDEGANDEWISVATQVSDHNGADEDTRYWNAFIEEEPAARFRTWFDIWVNRVNASSFMGSRVNAYYFGMESGGWLLWAGWSPMLDNSTEVITFLPMEFDDDSSAPAQYWDLMKIEMELDFEDSGTASDPYRVCIEDVNIDEKRLSPQAEIFSGVNTPIFIAPKVPDMPIGGILAPLYVAVASLAGDIWVALAGILALAWDAIGSQFPWFTQFVEDLYSLINSFTQFLATITTGLVALLDFIAGMFWLFPVITGAIGDTWALLTSWLDPFVANAGDWILLAVIVFGIIPFAANISEGRIKEVRADIEVVWGFISTILDWTFRLAKMVIDLVLGLIPG